MFISNDTPLVFHSLAGGVFAFKAGSTQCSFTNSPSEKDLTFDLYDQGVSAGNPQPPFGESAEEIDLNELLITNKIATVFCRVSGRSMEPHMRNGDILMVDKSIKP